MFRINIVLLVFIVTLILTCSGQYVHRYYNSTLTRERRQSTDTEEARKVCPAIENGKYEVIGEASVQGVTTFYYSVVKVTCNPPYTLVSAESTFYCFAGNWNGQQGPQCKRICPPRMSTKSVHVNCTLDGNPTDCSKPVDGTVMVSICKELYTPENKANAVSKCIEELWDYPTFKCVPVCGEIPPEKQKFLINGENINAGLFPWHVGIYRLQDGNYQSYCGGSIITPSIVLSVANCFGFAVTWSEQTPAEEYYVAAGKYFSNYNETRDLHAQTRHVKKYIIPASYQPYLTNHLDSDIAIVVLEKEFELNKVVQPVCIDWNNQYESEHLRPGNFGRVAGWGYSQPSIPTASLVLKQLNLPYVIRDECIRLIPNSYTRWLTSDKICAGYLNGTGICKGDAGGGLVFENTENNIQKFYLRGLVSYGFWTKELCDNEHYGIYTNVAVYLNLIKEHIPKNEQIN